MTENKNRRIREMLSGSNTPFLNPCFGIFVLVLSISLLLFVATTAAPFPSLSSFHVPQTALAFNGYGNNPSSGKQFDSNGANVGISSGNGGGGFGTQYAGGSTNQGGFGQSQGGQYGVNSGNGGSQFGGGPSNSGGGSVSSSQLPSALGGGGNGNVPNTVIGAGGSLGSSAQGRTGTGSFLRYQDPLHNVQINYPSDWSVKELHKRDVNFVGSDWTVEFDAGPKNDQPTVFIFAYDPYSIGESLAQYLVDDVNDYKHNNKHFNLIEANANIEIAGRPGYVIVATSQTKPGNFMEVGTIVDNKVYSIEYTAFSASDYDQYLPQVYQMIKSFSVGGTANDNSMDTNNGGSGAGPGNNNNSGNGGNGDNNPPQNPAIPHF